MADPAERVRGAIRKRLAGLAKLVRDEMAVIVADPPEPEWGTLAFEIDPFFYGITQVDVEEVVLSDEQAAVFLYDDPVCAEAGVDPEEVPYEELLSEEVLNWLADCWHSVGGSDLPYPGEAFFHGYHLDRFDFRSRQWRDLRSHPEAEA
jgi:hypothetical protein